MRNRLLIITFITLITSLIGVLAINASNTDPIAIESTEAPSETYLSRNKRSIGADIDVQTISASTRGLNMASDIKHAAWGWGNPFEPGGDGWVVGGTGNVGYPIGDVSLPILFSMLVIYFLYRGVSSSRRKSNF